MYEASKPNNFIKFNEVCFFSVANASRGLYFLIVFHTFLILVVTYVTPTAGVGYREKTHLVKLNEVVGRSNSGLFITTIGQY
jgi:hypothetical protein